MQLAVPSPRRIPLLSRRLRTLACCGIFATALPVARASSPVVIVDVGTILSLQTRVQQAPIRDQVQMYADLVDKISLLANRQIVDGNYEAAQQTLHLLESCTASIEQGLQQDSRGLKKTEMLLHSTNRRLVDMMHAASGDMKPIVENALKRLDKAQTVLLTAVFQH